MAEGDDPRGRVERAVAVAARVADASDALGVEARAKLLEASGLSREGVELALTEHLETHPSRAELDALVASARGAPPYPPAAHVVIAANVCTSALRAIAVALAASPKVFVKPSSRDPVLAELLIRELRADPAFRAAGGEIEIATDIDPAPGDELFVFGSDQTVEAIRNSVHPGVLVRGHGTGLGIAVIDGSMLDLRAAARALARDIIPFDQRGCLSPRAALVEGDAARAIAFGEALHEELSASPVPRGELDADARSELTLYRASIEAIGHFWEGPHHAVGVDPAPRALLLPPAARVVHVSPVTTKSALVLLEPWARYITAVGVDDDADIAKTILAHLPHARRSRLGEMQRPPFDGPVDRRPK